MQRTGEEGVREGGRHAGRQGRHRWKVNLCKSRRHTFWAVKCPAARQNVTMLVLLPLRRDQGNAFFSSQEYRGVKVGNMGFPKKPPPHESSNNRASGRRDQGSLRRPATTKNTSKRGCSIKSECGCHVPRLWGGIRIAYPDV